MTPQDFIKLIKNPDTVDSHHASDLKELTDRYPYFSQARLLYLKSLQKSNSIHFESQVGLSALYAADRNQLYFYLYPEAGLDKASDSHQRDARFSGSYFDLLDLAESEGEDARVSLKKIAESLKASRTMLAMEKKQPTEPEVVVHKVVATPKVEIPVIDYFKNEDAEKDLSLEEKSKLYIRQKKYKEAIEILKQLNLINPKKSIYFADQIRFLEKIIANTK
jgi:tetratricopeptide (TPR) repeat protein